jgi:hypothetical protein
MFHFSYNTICPLGKIRSESIPKERMLNVTVTFVVV